MEFLIAATAKQVFTGIGYFFVALLCLMFMIVVHEFGHLLAGRLLKFKVDEFAVGFGPAIAKYTSKKSGTKYALRAIPVGGFCAFHGEDDDDLVQDATSFTAQKPWKRIIVFMAGAIFNFISAILIISIFFMAYGDIMPTVTEVYPLESGEEHVLKEGDVILEVNGKSIYTISNKLEFVKMLDKAGGEGELTIVRDGEKIKLNVNKANWLYIDDDGNTEVMNGLGISYGFSQHKFGFFQSIGRAFVFCFKVIGVLFATIGGVFTGALGVSESLGGTATAIGAIMQVTEGGFGNLMYIVCVMSATIGIFNLLPFPALDGSKIVFTTIGWVRGKPINRRVENIIHIVGLVLLFGLTITLDLLHFLS